MSNNKFNFIFLITFIIYNTPINSYSAPTSWPLFTVPDKNIFVQNYIDILNCPPGYGRVHNHFKIPFSLLCKTFCPSSWAWLVNSDDKCHFLNSEFNLLHYEIIHYPNSDGGTLYSEIIAWYGNIIPHTKLSFITPKEYWFCIETDSPSHTISCANDI